MYLLDTNVVSELRKPRPHGAVLAWFATVDDMHLHVCERRPESVGNWPVWTCCDFLSFVFFAVLSNTVFFPAATLAEIQAGIEITREQDETKAAEIERWLDRLSASYNVLAMDATAFRAWARLMHRRSDTVFEDAMIAATARVHDLTVVTRNVGDFAPLGVRWLDPFSFKAGDG